MSKPIAIVTSDLHFNINTLPISSAALSAAIVKAEELKIPVIIAGDLNDTKAIIRAEVVNSLIELIRDARVRVYILVGNHDLINEKSSEHSLNFLNLIHHVDVEPRIDFLSELGLWVIPYYSDSEKLKKDLSNIPIGSTVIMHQGFLGAQMGDYIQDKTSIDPEVVKDFTVISGHYHRHQTIGTVTYIGSPYTITFGEANDGPKGFLILNEDGTFTREILKLRKHVVYNWNLNDLSEPAKNHGPEDLVWIKITGSPSELKSYDKKGLGDRFVGHQNFKLELISTEQEMTTKVDSSFTEIDIIDTLINDLPESKHQKEYLKQLWLSLCD